MRRALLAMLSASALMALVAMSAAAAHGGETTWSSCSPSAIPTSRARPIRRRRRRRRWWPARWRGHPARPGRPVLACPAVVLSTDTPTDGIGATPTDFDYTVTDGANTYSLSADGMLMAAKLCETDMDLDSDGDGTKSPDTCLDVSMYSFSPIAEGPATITQTTPVGDSRFDTIRYTPAEHR